MSYEDNKNLASTTGAPLGGGLVSGTSSQQQILQKPPTENEDS